MEKISKESSPSRGCQGCIEDSSVDWRGLQRQGFPKRLGSKEWDYLGSSALILLSNWETNGCRPWNKMVIRLAKLDVLASVLDSLMRASYYWVGHVPGLSWNSTAMVLVANRSLWNGATMNL